MSLAARDIEDIQLNIGKELTTVTIHGTKVDITPDNNVTVYTDGGVVVKAAEAGAAETKSLVGISDDFNSVAVYGTTIERAADGSLIIRTNGNVKIEAPAAEEYNAEFPRIPSLGARMPDGTIFAGISPDTNQPMYAAPKDAPVSMKFNEAAAYAEGLKLGGKKGFRLPSEAELDVLMQNRDKGALKGTFAQEDTVSGTSYWSSTIYGGNLARVRRLKDGAPGATDRERFALSVRCVR